MVKVGTFYRSTNKFNRNVPAKVLLIVISISLFTGFLFEKITYFFSISSWLLFIIKCALAASCLQISRRFIKFIQSRSRRLNYLIIFSVSLFAWYGFWSTLMGEFESKSFFHSVYRPFSVLKFYAVMQNYQDIPLFTDTFAFFISVMFFSEISIGTDYFCEDCKKYYVTELVGYTDKINIINAGFKNSKRGCYHFLKQYPLDIGTPSELYDGKLLAKGSPLVKPNTMHYYYSITLIYCNSCKTNSMITMEKRYSYVKKIKGNWEVVSGSDGYLFPGALYIDQTTYSILMSQLNQSKASMFAKQNTKTSSK